MSSSEDQNEKPMENTEGLKGDGLKGDGLNEGAAAAPEYQEAQEGSADVVAMRREVEEYKDKYLRALAELENYKKRVIRERSELIKYQGERIIYDLLDVADNLERAIEGAKVDPKSLEEGLPLIHKLLVDTFRKWDIKAESGLGAPFDPSRFKAVSRVAVDDAAPGTIISEMRKTYFYKDKLLRAGEVVVAAERERDAPPNDSESDPS